MLPRILSFLHERMEYDDALADLNQSVRIDPGDANAYYYLGIVHKFRGDIDEAMAAFEKCIELSSDAQLTEEANNQLVKLKGK